MKPFFTLYRLIQDERGAVFPIIAVLLVGMVGASGAAIDMSRTQLVQAKLVSSLDAAGLAGRCCCQHSRY